MNRERLLAVVIAATSAALCAFVVFDPSHDAATPPHAAMNFAPVDPLRRGVNILGYDGIWTGGVDAPFRMDDFEQIRAAGFDHVRINFFGLRFMDEGGLLDPAVLSRLDRILNEAEARGLAVILDQHDNKACQLAQPSCKPQLASFWSQVALRYKGVRPHLTYELLNEPGGHMTHEQWNDTLAAVLGQLREIDPERRIVVAALNGDDPRDIEKLSLPATDRNLIVTVHYYAPMRFTHQGAPWSNELKGLRDVGWGTAADREKVDTDFAFVGRWAKQHDRPVYLGEFGVYDAAPLSARTDWLGYVSGAAERYGWGWSVWQFDHDFSLFDQGSRAWRKTLLDALMQRARMR